MTTATAAGVLVSRPAPDVVHLRLDNPAKRNPLSVEARAGLVDALRAAQDDPACRFIVIDGAGGHFCSGGDISGMDSLTPLSLRERIEPLYDLVRAIVFGKKVVVAAVEGHAAGAGTALAAACDVVVASTGSMWTCSFNRIGLMPDMGALWVLPRRMGFGRARLFALTAERMSGEEAVRQGLADVACAPGEALATALAWLDKLRPAAPVALSMTKQMFARDPMTLEAALAFERECQAILVSTDDFREGVTAFTAKRSPAFRGR